MAAPLPYKQIKIECKPYIYDNRFIHLKADAILRCPDGRKSEQGGLTLFAHRKAVLAVASSLFEILFNLPWVEDVKLFEKRAEHILRSLLVVDMRKMRRTSDSSSGSPTVDWSTTPLFKTSELPFAGILLDSVGPRRQVPSLSTVAAFLAFLVSDDVPSLVHLSTFGPAIIHHHPEPVRKVIIGWGVCVRIGRVLQPISKLPAWVFDRVPGKAPAGF